MSLNSLFSQSNTLTHRRKVYAQTVLNSAIAQAAKDLQNGLETRDVIVPAIAGIVAAYVPNSGKGHADRVRETVEQQIDSAMSETEESDAA